MLYKIIKTIFFLTFLFFFSVVNAQTINTFKIDSTATKQDLNIWQTIKYDGKSFFSGVGHSFTQPLRWKQKDFLTAGGIIGGSALVYIFDTDAQSFFSKQEDDIPQIIKDFGWYYGSPQNFFFTTGGIYAFGLITKNEAVRKVGVLIITSAVTAGFIQSLSKTVVGRARPAEGIGKFDFKLFSSEAAYHSFPSGHSVLSFTMAHSIAKQFDNFWTKAGIYTLGSIAPISRLWADAHWLTDIVLGSALAIVVVDGVDNFLNKKNNRYSNRKQNKISWRINAGIGKIGIVGTF